MAVTLNDMLAAVYDITKRPELVTITKSAIKRATIRAHSVDFFPRDRSSVVFSFTPTTDGSFTDIPGLYTAAPLYRIGELLQCEDLVTQRPTENLEYIVGIDEFWDENNQRRTSVFTQVGESLRCSFAAATGRARLWYYVMPDTSDSSYSSWIADRHTEEVAQWAAGIVWLRTGLQEQAQGADLQVQSFKDLLITTYLSSKV